jgi:hypothetical protein
MPKDWQLTVDPRESEHNGTIISNCEKHINDNLIMSLSNNKLTASSSLLTHLPPSSLLQRGLKEDHTLARELIVCVCVCVSHTRNTLFSLLWREGKNFVVSTYLLATIDAHNMVCEPREGREREEIRVTQVDTRECDE